MRFVILLLISSLLISCEQSSPISAPQSDPSPPLALLAPPSPEEIRQAKMEALEAEIADIKRQISTLEKRLEKAKLELATVDGPINLNSASKDVLMQLPRCGEKTAVAIIKYRPIEVLEDLLMIPGIGQKTLDLWEPYVTCEGN